MPDLCIAYRLFLEHIKEDISSESLLTVSWISSVYQTYACAVVIYWITMFSEFQFQSNAIRTRFHYFWCVVSFLILIFRILYYGKSQFLLFCNLLMNAKQVKFLVFVCSSWCPLLLIWKTTSSKEEKNNNSTYN